MKIRLFGALFCLISLVTSAAQLFAVDRDLEIVRGLRERNYFDYASLYLDKMADRVSTPPEVRQLISYERAVTLRETAKTIRNPEKQFELLDQAITFLEQFVRDTPDHPNVGDANSDLAQILMQKAEVEIIQSKSPSNKASKADYQRRGRDLLQKAGAILKLAFQQHEEAFQKFPTFIDGQKEPKLEAERDHVERSMILESLSLAKCTYLEAQSNDASSREFRQKLTTAADEYEKVYQKYRRKAGGLHARAWQGKCYDEQGDRQKALGIYNEILEQPDAEVGMQALKTQTLLFKLSCLYGGGDFQTIVDLAEEWQKKNGTESKSQAGLGIQWEQARALEAIGDDRNLAKADQEKNWRQARTAAQQISRFPGEYKDASQTMMQRLQTKLGGKERKAEDFDSAYALARQSFDQAQEIRKSLDQASRSGTSAEDVTRLKRDWTTNLNESIRNFEIATATVRPKDNPKDVTAAKLMYAYANFYLRRNYEAAVLAQFVVRTTTDPDQDSVAMEAAFIAMAAFVQEFNQNRADPENKQEDMRLILKAASVVTERWPDSEKANEARMVLGQMYKASRKYLEAAEWFKKVPESDPKYAEAQMAAGQALWGAYGAAGRLPKDSRPPAETFAEWKSSAESHLRKGIGIQSKLVPAEDELPQELAIAKISLAENLLSQDKEKEAISLLKDDPHSVVKAIAVEDESQRPDQGVKRRPIAKLTYILLLRAYIGQGVERLDDARAAMKSLEAVVAGDANSDLTDLYVELGRTLKTELEGVRNSGESAQVKKLMTSFEAFLDDMFKKREGQTFGSLSWIGETYFTLGEMSSDASKATRCYDRAANAFNLILERVKADAAFATSDQVLNVKVRLAHFNRLKREFATADRLLAEVMKERPNDWRTQVEAASVYQDWGSADDRQKLVVAITGSKEQGIWGWAGIAKRIQQQKDFSERPEMVDTFLDARYGVTLCRFRHAQLLSGKDKQKALDTCAMELIGSSTILKSMPDDKREKLNELYREVLKDAGKPVKNLPRKQDTVDEQAKPKEAVAADAADQKPNLDKPEPQKAAPNSQKTSANNSSQTWVALLMLAVVGISIVGWIFMSGRKRTGRSSVLSRSSALKTKSSSAPFTGITIGNSTGPTVQKDTPVVQKPVKIAKPRPASIETPEAPPLPTSTESPKSPRRHIFGNPAIKPIPQPPSESNDE